MDAGSHQGLCTKIDHWCAGGLPFTAREKKEREVGFVDSDCIIKPSGRCSRANSEVGMATTFVYMVMKDAGPGGGYFFQSKLVGRHRKRSGNRAPLVQIDLSSAFCWAKKDL